VIKDIVGNEIKLDSMVIVAHNGRIIIGQVKKLNDRSDSVTVVPVHSDSGGRRQAPCMKPFRRADYNVFVINEGEALFAALKGYTTIQDAEGELDRKWWAGEITDEEAFD
jgi:hypothetical protein